MATSAEVHRRRRPFLWALVAAGAAVIVVGMVVMGIATFNLVDAIRQQQKANTNVNATILDCTRPEGKCAQEGRKRTADAVNNIGRLSVYASACAADVDPTLPVRQRVNIIERCVTKLVEQQAAADLP